MLATSVFEVALLSSSQLLSALVFPWFSVSCKWTTIHISSLVILFLLAEGTVKFSLSSDGPSLGFLTVVFPSGWWRITDLTKIVIMVGRTLKNKKVEERLINYFVLWHSTDLFLKRNSSLFLLLSAILSFLLWNFNWTLFILDLKLNLCLEPKTKRECYVRRGSGKLFLQQWFSTRGNFGPQGTFGNVWRHLVITTWGWWYTTGI